MARLNHFVLSILILQIYVHAAPSEVSKVEDIAKVEKADPKLDSETKEIKSSNNNTTETQRQKRWYNPYGYSFPPINTQVYPPYTKKVVGSVFYDEEDPLLQIQRRVQEITNIVRPPPPPPHIPIFYPVWFIPTSNCNCNVSPTTPGTNTNRTQNSNQTEPNISNRWPDMDDERQNWGFVLNETDTDDDDGEDFSRPISFNPIRVNRPAKPPPPVEHGTIQSDANDNDGQSQPTTPTLQTTPSPPANSFAPQNNPQMPPSLVPPSPCDGAILTCCHQPQVSYDCFAIQGCPDFTSYGNPCDTNLILGVIEKFQRFYGQKGG